MSSEHLNICQFNKRGSEELAAVLSTATAVINCLVHGNGINTIHPRAEYVTGGNSFNVDPFRESFNRPTPTTTSPSNDSHRSDYSGYLNSLTTATTNPSNVEFWPGFREYNNSAATSLNARRITTSTTAPSSECDSLSIKNVNNPQYTRFAVRLGSYNGWPAHTGQQPAQLAIVGFFFIPVGRILPNVSVAVVV